MECTHYTEGYDLHSEGYEFCAVDKEILAHAYHKKSCTVHHRVLKICICFCGLELTVHNLLLG